MLEKIYLLWDSYKANRTYLIGCLSKKGNNYVFEYEKEALLAYNDGCMLPFPYTDGAYCFNSLPPFFERRINYRKGKINDELQSLLENNGRINNDNFHITDNVLKNDLNCKKL